MGKKQSLLDLLKVWVKTEQDPLFWNYAKRLNLFVMLLDLPTRRHNFLVRGMVSLVRLAQLKAFHDGMQRCARKRQGGGGTDRPPLSQMNRGAPETGGWSSFLPCGGV